MAWSTYGVDGDLGRHVERHGGEPCRRLRGIKVDRLNLSIRQDEEHKENTCQDILAMLQSCISDPHARVRYAVIYTVGQLALAFEEEDFPASAADASLRALRMGFDYPEPRIQCQSALSLVNLTEVTSTDIDPAHVQALVTRSVSALDSRPPRRC